MIDSPPYYSIAAVYLIDTLFGIFLMLVMLRLLLQMARADFYNPICQFLVKITNPVLVPLRRIIPGWRGIDLSSVVALFVLQMLTLVLTHLAVGKSVHLNGLIVMSLAELISLLLNVFLITILIQAILSWVSAGTYHPLTALLHQLNEPVLRPARRLLPPVSGIDLSPLVVLVALQLIKILVVAPIVDLGRSLG